MATLRDVAKKAKVGVGTVSRMINQSGYVADDTRKCIEQAMKDLNYTPNELARNLYRKKSGIIAIILPNLANPFFAEFVDFAEAEIYKRGYKMMICNTEKEQDAELEYLEMLNRHIVDGIITAVSSLSEEVYENIHKPIVCMDRYLGENIPIVTVDHKTGGRLAAETLIANGCKKVLHFKGSTSVKSPYHDRHTEFNKTMEENGIEVKTILMEWNRLDYYYYQKVVKDILKDNLDYDGVFGVDLLALNCMNEFIRRGKRVPEDVKIVSYDGTYITDIVEPPITSIKQPIDKLAQSAVDMLIMQIEEDSIVPHEIVLPLILKKGRTTLV